MKRAIFLIKVLYSFLMTLVFSGIFQAAEYKPPYQLGPDTRVLSIFHDGSNQQPPDTSLRTLQELAQKQNDRKILLETSPGNSLYLMDSRHPLKEGEIMLYEKTSFQEIRTGQTIYLNHAERSVVGIFDETSPLRRWSNGPDYVFPLADLPGFSGTLYLSGYSPDETAILSRSLREDGYGVTESLLRRSSWWTSLEVMSFLPSLFVAIFSLAGTCFFTIRKSRRAILVHYSAGGYLSRSLPLFFLQYLLPVLTGILLGTAGAGLCLRQLQDTVLLTSILIALFFSFFSFAGLYSFFFRQFFCRVSGSAAHA